MRPARTALGVLPEVLPKVPEYYATVSPSGRIVGLDLGTELGQGRWVLRGPDGYTAKLVDTLHPLQRQAIEEARRRNVQAVPLGKLRTHLSAFFGETLHRSLKP